MPTTVTIYTGDIWSIGTMVVAALCGVWAIKKVIKIANKS